MQKQRRSPFSKSSFGCSALLDEHLTTIMEYATPKHTCTEDDWAYLLKDSPQMSVETDLALPEEVQVPSARDRDAVLTQRYQRLPKQIPLAQISDSRFQTSYTYWQDWCYRKQMSK